MRQGHGLGAVFEVRGWPSRDTIGPRTQKHPHFGTLPLLVDDPAAQLDAPMGGGPVDYAALAGRLERLANTLHARGVDATEPGPGSHRIPAGYTYLAQFAIHDIVASRMTGSDHYEISRQSRRQQSLVLDALYGDGPALSPTLYERPATGGPRGRFRIARMVDRAGQPTTPYDIPRLELGPMLGEPAAPPVFEPHLADARNADTLILSQLTVLWMQAHNRIFDAARAAGSRDPHDTARRHLTAIYRTILRGDLLPRLIEPGALAAVPADASLPLESVLAGLRFGHAMARSGYRINARRDVGSGSLAQLLGFAGGEPTPLLPVTDDWAMDWGLYFFDPDRAPPGANLARPIGLRLAPAMAFPLGSAVPMPADPATTLVPAGTYPLAYLTMLKGLRAGLASGQAVADRAAADGTATPLPHAAVAAALRAAGDDILCLYADCHTADDDAFFALRMPLFAYVLAEAEAAGTGRLGPVGSMLVARAFATLGSAVPPGDWARLFPDLAMPGDMPALVAFATASQPRPTGDRT